MEGIIKEGSRRKEEKVVSKERVEKGREKNEEERWKEKRSGRGLKGI